MQHPQFITVFMSLGAKTKGIAGLVIDGCVRDADDIEAMGFPVFKIGRASCRERV